MSRIFWLLFEIVVGLVVAGVLVGAGIGVSVQAGYQVAPWMVWTGLVVCVALAVAVGESLRRPGSRV